MKSRPTAPPLIPLVATRAFAYGTPRVALTRGARFTAPEKDARLLIAVGRAAAPAEAPPPKPKPTPRAPVEPLRTPPEETPAPDPPLEPPPIAPPVDEPLEAPKHPAPAAALDEDDRSTRSPRRVVTPRRAGR